MKYVYPAVFSVDLKDPEYIGVQFPDIIPGVTFGDSFDDAMFMAKDLLKLMLTEAPQQCFPPSTIERVQKEYPGKRVVLVEVEIEDQ